ncbi:fibroleukin-like [Saccostrea cucullata]|uniref:fibroleukin-like n=1 Tax=Saccostrea cuccullata TaxID=36930 RepID=UPI002ED695F3
MNPTAGNGGRFFYRYYFNVCDHHDCQNGTCGADKTSARGYRCNCVESYGGENCEVRVCDSHVCMNGGLCEADQTSARGYKCNCFYGYVGDSCEVLAIDCKVYRDIGYTESGVYSIYPFGPSSESVRTYCDMETLDGGWTAIQNRINESVSFERNWADYRIGFGGPEHSFWIGNDAIHQLTKGNDSSLYVTIKLRDGRTLYELYDRFLVSSETENYQLFLGGPASGTLGDGMLHTQDNIFDLSGMYFSTFDKDNDRSGSNCAEFYRGGWWFNACFNAFLNGPWAMEDWAYPWFPTVLSGEDVMETRMMVKRL